MKVIKKPKILPSACLHCGALIQLKWKDLHVTRTEKGKRRKRGVTEVATCPLCNGPIFPQFEQIQAEEFIR